MNQSLILSGFILKISAFGLEKSAFWGYWGAELLPCESLKKRIKERSLVKFAGGTDKMQTKVLSLSLWHLLTLLPTVTQGSKLLLESYHCCDVMKLTVDSLVLAGRWEGRWKHKTFLPLAAVLQTCNT